MNRKAIVFKKNTKNKLERCKRQDESSIAEVITRLTNTYGMELLKDG